MKEHEKITLERIKTHAEHSLKFIENMDFTAFSNDLMTKSAVAFNLSQIGELTGKLGNEFHVKHGHIPWEKMKDLGNRILYDCDSVEHEVVWTAIEGFLPDLILEIDELL